ncbi:MAG: cell filamentation protein Fic [Alphaproteobacteria bacterium]|nr:cell filamentation protein Fic [Alphaproteobacteria bacterium]
MELRLDPPSTFQGTVVPAGTSLVGWAAIVHALGLKAPVRRPSCVSDSHVRGSRRTDGNWRILDKRYAPGNRFEDHLGFALRHEPIDLLILKRAFESVPAPYLENFVKSAPTGTLTRRVWFFCERLTGKQLDIEDAPAVTAVEALDPKSYFTGKAILSRRHRVRDNLLGSGSYCPVIRRTEKLEKFVEAGLAQRAAETIGRTGARLVARAASFLLLADSRASFEIEGERPPRSRLERWGRAVLQAGKSKLSLDELGRLHSVLIEDTRFIRPGLRPDGVFLGERDHDGDPLPEFIGARPDDLDSLVAGLLAANERMRESGLDAVLQAAATAFGFVYVHPYQDGNGRVHRCLIHHVLAERGYTPPGMVFPVSSVMLTRIEDYGRILKNHSGPLMDFIEWRPTENRNVEVLNDTSDLYRYFDGTEAAEFLYTCVERTVDHDLPQEIDYLRRHDEAQRRIMETIEMPDRLAQDIIMFMRQNGGSIPKARREKELASLTDDEARRIEAVYRDVFAEEARKT